MKKIYVVTSGQYSDYIIEKIFEKKEDAEKYLSLVNNKWCIYNNDIEEYELITHAPEMATKGSLVVTINEDRVKEQRYEESPEIDIDIDPSDFWYRCDENYITFKYSQGVRDDIERARMKKSLCDLVAECKALMALECWTPGMVREMVEAKMGVKLQEWHGEEWVNRNLKCNKPNRPDQEIPF